MTKETERRKTEHIRISLNENTQARFKTTGLEDVNFVHRALPQIDKNSIDLSTIVFDHKFAAPIIVGAITGGSSLAKKINSSIATTIEELNLGMGVGSQRAALEDRRLRETFTIVRKKAPTAFLIANIGGVQLANGYGLKEVREAIEMIDADAVAIHLNPLQEAIQPEGQTNFRNILEELGNIAKELDKPVIVKETGAGISAEDAEKLEKAGVKGVDISGAGGTSFAAVEYHRATEPKDRSNRILGETFWDWGIPTAASLLETLQSVNIPVIASGGIRNGIDAAKTIALGASLASLSYPILREANKGVSHVKAELLTVIDELKNTMFLTGAENVEHLTKVPLVITDRTLEWSKIRGFDIEGYARRRS